MSSSVSDWCYLNQGKVEMKLGLDRLVREFSRGYRVVFLERRVPTIIRHFPEHLRSIIYKTYLKITTGVPQGRIHLVYFSCRKHYKYLRVSLRSLARLNAPYVGSVYLYIDSNDPLTDEQIGELDSIALDTVVVPTSAIKGWGVGMVSIEISAFAEVAGKAQQGDYIAKVDSDIAFVSDRIFEYVLRSGCDLVGDGPYINYKYAQGGMYFLNARIIPEIAQYQGDKLREIMTEELQTRAEDVAISALLSRHTDNVWLTKFLMFPEEMHNKGGFDAVRSSAVTALHFVQDKEKMVELWDSY